MKTIVGARKVPETNSKGQAVLDAFAKKLGHEEYIRQNGESYSKKHLDAFIDMVIYGEMQKAEEYEKKAIAATPDEEIAAIKAEAAAQPKKKVRHKGSPPPPGWSPVGDSLAKPKEIDPASAAMLADRAQMKLDAAEERILFDKYEKSYQENNKYRSYYFSNMGHYPYRVWDKHHHFNLNNWANKMLNGFVMVDGVYIKQ